MGVWIETSSVIPSIIVDWVTPCVGVWIETGALIPNWAAIWCHTLRGCVDWNTAKVGEILPCYVTPCVGVWIETDYQCDDSSALRVTPCVGVWIETAQESQILLDSQGHTLRGCVDWNTNSDEVSKVLRVTPCVGVWIETPFLVHKRTTHSHTLRGCVDWNIGTANTKKGDISHTLRGCVDWNLFLLIRRFILMSHPAWVCGLKHLLQIGTLVRVCHTLRGCVDWNRISSLRCILPSRHTLRGCVDWNTDLATEISKADMSHPAWVCGLKLT